jgi:hypothetical protein
VSFGIFFTLAAVYILSNANTIRATNTTQERIIDFLIVSEKSKV